MGSSSNSTVLQHYKIINLQNEDSTNLHGKKTHTKNAVIHI